jgi:hypothetical protein
MPHLDRFVAAGLNADALDKLKEVAASLRSTITARAAGERVGEWRTR